MSAQGLSKLPKLLILGIVLVGVLTINTPLTFAQQVSPSPAPSGPPKDKGADPSDKNYGAGEHTSFLGENIVGALIPCLIEGTPTVAGVKCSSYDPATGKLKLYSYVPGGGALGGLGNIMVAMYTSPPTSTTWYLANIGSNLGLVKNAYALDPPLQSVGGSGDQILIPVAKLWQAMRNLAYAAFIVVFLVVGFMIMFRQKINPQTVVTIQSSLPGLVIGLVLVTFSYFISALIVDLSFLAVRVVAAFFQGSLGTGGHDFDKLATSTNIFGLFGLFLDPGVFGRVIGGVSSLFSSTALQNTLQVFGDDAFSKIFGEVAKHLSGLTGGAIGVVVAAVILIAMTIQMFRLAWALVTSYITILVLTIFSPFIILFASLPGRGGILALWWRNLLGNVLVFPAVFAAFLFAGTLLVSPDAYYEATLPLFAGITSEILKSIIGFGVILGSSAIPGMVKSALGVKDIQGITQAAGAAVGGGQGVLGAGYGRATSRISGARESQRRNMDPETVFGKEGQKPSGFRQRIARIIPT